jgi:hypothetical protein
MGTTEPEHTAPTYDAPPAPQMALRTYMCLRLGAVGVIAVLAVSLVREYHAAGDCLQGSISAYYYTSVQSVFVGALTAMGLVMIVLWGKTPWEDGALNLAGLVAPVVAFVPTARTNKCGLTTTTGADVTTEAQKAAVIKASHDAVDNNMLAYLIVVGTVLVILVVAGTVAHLWTRWAFVTDHPLSYWGPLAVAGVLYLLGADRFWHDRAWFYGHAHAWSAITLFVFIVLVVIDIGYQKWPRTAHPDREPRWFWSRFLEANPDPRASRGWAWTYWALAAVMVIGAAAIQLLAGKISHGFGEHRTFFVEAWMIGWLAIFWLLQTWDRRNEGAPPRTKAEVQRMGT